MSKWIRKLATPLAQTGNNTHASVVFPPDTRPDTLGFLFVVEAIGGSPTVTYKWQYTLAGDDITDANATWIDLPYHIGGVVPEVAAVTATRARTTVSQDVLFPSYGSLHREQYRRVRLVTSANTNVTYHGEIFGQDE